MNKNLEMMANVVFSVDKKKQKLKKNILTKKKFSLFRYLPWAPPNTLKLYFGKMLDETK